MRMSVAPTKNIIFGGGADFTEEKYKFGRFIIVKFNYGNRGKNIGITD